MADGNDRIATAPIQRHGRDAAKGCCLVEEVSSLTTKAGDPLRGPAREPLTVLTCRVDPEQGRLLVELPD